MSLIEDEPMQAISLLRNGSAEFDSSDFSLRPVNSFDLFAPLPQPTSFLLQLNRNISVSSFHGYENQQSSHQPNQQNSILNTSFEFNQLNSINPFYLSAQNSLSFKPELNNNSFQMNHSEFGEVNPDSFDFMNLYPENDISPQEECHHLQNTNLLQINNERYPSNPFSAAGNNLRDLPSIGVAAVAVAVAAAVESNQSEAQLLKLSDFDMRLPEMEFEAFSDEEQRQIRDINISRVKKGQIELTENDRYGGQLKAAASKHIEKQKRRDYDKNICRYIARQMMRCFISEEYDSVVRKQFCENDSDIHDEVKEFVKSQYPGISGHKTFKELLQIQKEEEETSVEQCKIIFQKYAKWFLKERAIRYIILGSSEDKIQYIRFKNQVMLHFINRPEKWNSNLKITSKPFRVRIPKYPKTQELQPEFETQLSDSNLNYAIPKLTEDIID